jgi:hypothetical protein
MSQTHRIFYSQIYILKKNAHRYNVLVSLIVIYSHCRQLLL